MNIEAKKICKSFNGKEVLTNTNIKIVEGRNQLPDRAKWRREDDTIQDSHPSG